MTDDSSRDACFGAATLSSIFIGVFICQYPNTFQGIDGLRNHKQEEDHLFERTGGDFCQSCHTEQVDDPDSPGAKRQVVDCRSNLEP